MSDETIDFLTNAEDRIQNALRSDDYFEGVKVLLYADGDLTAQIEQALAGLGMFLVIRVYGGPVPLAGDYESWNLEIVITENVLLNRGGDTATGKTSRFMLQNLFRVIRSTNVCDLTDAQEVNTEGFIVWQVKGAINVAVPVAES